MKQPENDPYNYDFSMGGSFGMSSQSQNKMSSFGNLNNDKKFDPLGMQKQPAPVPIPDVKTAAKSNKLTDLSNLPNTFG